MLGEMTAQSPCSIVKKCENGAAYIVEARSIFQSEYFERGSVTKNIALPPSVSLKLTLPCIIFASSSAMLSVIFGNANGNVCMHIWRLRRGL